MFSINLPFCNYMMTFEMKRREPAHTFQIEIINVSDWLTNCQDALK